VPDPSAALHESPIARSLRGAETSAKLVLAAERYKREERRCIAMMILKRGNLEWIRESLCNLKQVLSSCYFKGKTLLRNKQSAANQYIYVGFAWIYITQS
jgi:hypothetical protein